MKVTIDTSNLRGEIAPLYNRYSRQTNPQPAYVYLTEDGDVGADYSGEIGNSVPMAVWNNRTLHWGVKSDINGNLLADFLENEARPLLEKVHEGHEVDWDGNNHVGLLSDEAKIAAEQLQDMLDNLWQNGEGGVWKVDSWLDGVGLLENWPEGIPLATAIADIESSASEENVVLDGDIEEYLLDSAENYFDRKPETLSWVHVKTLVDEGRISKEDAEEWHEEFNVD